MFSTSLPAFSAQYLLSLTFSCPPVAENVVRRQCAHDLVSTNLARLDRVLDSPPYVRIQQDGDVNSASAKPHLQRKKGIAVAVFLAVPMKKTKHAAEIASKIKVLHQNE